MKDSNNLLFVNKSIVSKEKAEKVVYEPSKPTIKKYLIRSWDKILFCSKYINNPIKKDPKTFTTRVPTNE